MNFNLDPPPSTVKDFRFQWKTWLNNLYEWLIDNVSKDFYTEVAKGNVAGHSLVHKFGRNDAVPNGSWERVALLSVASFHLTAATTVRIKAGGDVTDTAAGTGAREITVQGIAADGTEQTETIATAGVNASGSTTFTFWRVHRAWVSSIGTYSAANTAAITIENTAGTQDLVLVAAGEGQTQYAGYTIPLKKTGYLLSVLATVDSNKVADMKLMTRKNITDTSAPVSSIRLKNYWDGLAGVFTFHPRSPSLVLPALTDIWIEAQGSGAVAEVSADFEILLVDD